MPSMPCWPWAILEKEALPTLKQLPEGLGLEESIRQAWKLLVKK